MNEPQKHFRPLSAESCGEAPGRARLRDGRILVVGGGQRVVDAATDPMGDGRAMSILFAREGAQVAVAGWAQRHASVVQIWIATMTGTRRTR